MVGKLRDESRKAYLKQREEQVMDQWRRNLDDEKRVFGNVNLTQIEKRLAELKEDQYRLAQKLRVKEVDEQQYNFPGAEDDDKPLSGKDRVFNKLVQKYKDDSQRGGPPEKSQEEIFMDEKLKTAMSGFGPRNRKEDPA